MPVSVVDIERYYLRTHSNYFQKSRFLLADAGSGSGSDTVVVGVADYVVAAVDRWTTMGMNRRAVVDYNQSVGGTGRLP